MTRALSGIWIEEDTLTKLTIERVLIDGRLDISMSRIGPAQVDYADWFVQDGILNVVIGYSGTCDGGEQHGQVLFLRLDTLNDVLSGICAVNDDENVTVRFKRISKDQLE